VQLVGIQIYNLKIARIKNNTKKCFYLLWVVFRFHSKHKEVFNCFCFTVSYIAGVCSHFMPAFEYVTVHSKMYNFFLMNGGLLLYC
jgi:hypothetical protein